MQDEIKIGISNIFNVGIDVITFSLIGISIVFFGLLIISLYIGALPKILNFFGNIQKKKNRPEGPIRITPDIRQRGDEEILIAIATAIHLDQTYADEHQKITWNKDERRQSPWHTSGKLNELSIRSTFTRRRR